jgi:hypothetical protein
MPQFPHEPQYGRDQRTERQTSGVTWGLMKYVHTAVVSEKPDHRQQKCVLNGANLLASSCDAWHESNGCAILGPSTDGQMSRKPHQD